MAHLGRVVTKEDLNTKTRRHEDQLAVLTTVGARMILDEETKIAQISQIEEARRQGLVSIQPLQRNSHFYSIQISERADRVLPPNDNFVPSCLRV